MKNLICLICFMSLLSWASAQNLGGGLSVGANFSQIDGDNYGGFRQAGLSLGGFVAFRLSEKFILQPEFLYDQLGSANKERTFAIRLNYFTIPILANFRIPITIGNDVSYLGLQAGPAFGILLTAIDQNFSPPNNDLTSDFKSTDVRILVGAQFDMGRRWAFTFRYGYSLIPIAVGTSNRFPTGPYNNYIQMTFRYYLTTLER